MLLSGSGDFFFVNLSGRTEERYKTEVVIGFKKSLVVKKTPLVVNTQM